MRPKVNSSRFEISNRFEMSLRFHGNLHGATFQTIARLYRKSKQAYYDKYFERNWNNIKNTWKGIKSLISLKTVASNVPTVLSLDNGDTITSPNDIANTFNNYFVSIAETTKKHKIYT